MIERSLSKLSPGELKIKQEVEKLTKKLSQLTSELDQLQSKREDSVKPLRSRGLDLSEKLENIRSQLLSIRNVRERSLSLTSLGKKEIH